MAGRKGGQLVAQNERSDVGGNDNASIRVFC